MTHHDKALELVEQLRQWDGCWPAPGLERDVEAAADLITAQAERCRVLEEALRLIADIETPQAQVLLIARAALTSTGEKG